MIYMAGFGGQHLRSVDLLLLQLLHVVVFKFQAGVQEATRAAEKLCQETDPLVQSFKFSAKCLIVSQEKMATTDAALKTQERDVYSIYCYLFIIIIYCIL